MDFTKFSDDNFDVKDWVNTALQAQKDTNITVDNHATNLVTKLQLFIQEVSKSLEQTSQDALNSIPRVLREVENIKIETSLLKNQMTMVKDDIRKVEENTASSMKKLIEIDGVKSRMQGACNALQEADKWTILSSDVEELFEENDLIAVADKLIGMQNSLEVLRDVPDFNERAKVLQNHKNKLEALLSPTLVQIFNKHDLDEARRYVKLFSELDRLSQLQTYYNNCHKSSLMKTWKSVREDPNKPMTLWLPIFYDHLLALWHREISWCGQVFPDPVQALCVLMSQTINSLNPSIGGCMKESLQEGQDNLDILIQLQDGTIRFAQGLEKAVSTFQATTDTLSVHLPQLLQIIHSPFQKYLLHYSQLQQTQLMSVIDAFSMDSSELSDCAESLSDYITDSFRIAEQALDNCLKFTHAYGAVGLIDAYKLFFIAFFGCINEVLQKLRKHHLLDTDNKDGNLNSGDHTTSDQWTNFQHAFRIIEMCGMLLTKTTEFRRRVFADLNTSVELIVHENRETTTSVSSLTKNYLKSHPGEWDKVVELQQMMATYEIEAILPSLGESVQTLNEQAHHFAFDIIFVHFKHHLLTISKMEIWCSSEKESVDGALPTFSLSPLPYITHVGDSLLTLPQQLEPFFVQDQNTNLLAALKVGKIPYQENQDGAHYDHQWLESFARGAMKVYADSILKITMVTDYATRQLTADIDYFFNILSALEITSIPQLRQIKQLLELNTEGLHLATEDESLDNQIVKTICKMRKVIF